MVERESQEERPFPHICDRAKSITTSEPDYTSELGWCQPPRRVYEWLEDELSQLTFSEDELLVLTRKIALFLKNT